MSREKVSNTKISNKAAARLQKVMLDYHDFCAQKPSTHFAHELMMITQWQSERLKQTHSDLYLSPQYTSGLKFLLSDLYSAKDFGGRDKDLERIFPKIIALMPQSVIGTVATLIELNLLTKTLDYQLTQALFHELSHTIIDEKSYCEAYRHCNNLDQRFLQIKLISEVGKKLDRYARSSLIHFSLKVSETPAEMAGLEALHSFIMQGFSAFHSMENVDSMMQTLVQRETEIMNNIYRSESQPFNLNECP